MYSFSFSISVASLFFMQIYIFTSKNVFPPKMTSFPVTPSWLPLDTAGFGKQCYLECSMWFCKACCMYLEKGFKAKTLILNNFCTTPVGFICWKKPNFKHLFDKGHTDMENIVSGDGVVPNTTSIWYMLPVHPPHYSKVAPRTMFNIIYHGKQD